MLVKLVAFTFRQLDAQQLHQTWPRIISVYRPCASPSVSGNCKMLMFHCTIISCIVVQILFTVYRITLERLNQLEAWVSSMADDFDEAALEAEAKSAKTQADTLLAEAAKDKKNTDRLRLKDHGDTRQRSRRSRSRSRERDRCASYSHCATLSSLV